MEQALAARKTSLFEHRDRFDHDRVLHQLPSNIVRALTPDLCPLFILPIDLPLAPAKSASTLSSDGKRTCWLLPSKKAYALCEKSIHPILPGRCLL